MFNIWIAILVEFTRVQQSHLVGFSGLVDVESVSLLIDFQVS